MDPLSPIISNVRAAVAYNARQYDRAIDAARKTIEFDKNLNISWVVSRVLPGNRRRCIRRPSPRWRKQSSARRRWSQAVGALAHAYAVSDRREKAMPLIDELKGRSARGQRCSGAHRARLCRPRAEQ